MIAAIAGAAGRAQADDFGDFQSAREPYDQGDYEEAVNRLEALVGGEVPRLTDPIYIQESRKYLGAAYLFVSRQEDAEEQFERIVRADPNQRMQAPTFAAHVVRVFDRVRDRVRDELAAEEERRRQEEEERRAEEMARLLRDRQRLERLEQLARTETVERENSRWLALIPFGIGQFQNEDTALGATFLVAEVALVAAAIGTFIAWNNFEFPDRPPGDPELEPFIERENALRVSNQVLFGLAAATIVGGVIEAEINFEPGRTSTRQRDLPEDLLPEVTPALSLHISPVSARLKLTF